MHPEKQFLIAVPTRNREETVLKSLPSLDPLLHHEDVRVVVSDNSDVPSTRLRDYCRSKGISWIRPNKVSSMTAHWDWILESQKYKAITIMTDRSWLIADVWLEAKKLAERGNSTVCWNYGTFSLKKLLGFKLGVYSSTPMNGKTYAIRLDDFVHILRQNHVIWFMPRLLNSIVFRQTIEKITHNNNSSLRSISPDFEFAYKYIYSSEEETFHYVNKCGIITHSGHLSNGGAFQTAQSNEAMEDFIALNSLTRYDYAPFPRELDSINATAHELNAILHKLGLDPYVNREMVRRIQAERQQKHKKGIARKIKSFLHIVGINNQTTLKIIPSDGLSSIRKLELSYNKNTPHELDSNLNPST